MPESKIHPPHPESQSQHEKNSEAISWRQRINEWFNPSEETKSPLFESRRNFLKGAAGTTVGVGLAVAGVKGLSEASARQRLENETRNPAFEVLEKLTNEPPFDEPTGMKIWLRDQQTGLQAITVEKQVNWTDGYTEAEYYSLPYYVILSDSKISGGRALECNFEEALLQLNDQSNEVLEKSFNSRIDQVIFELNKFSIQKLLDTDPVVKEPYQTFLTAAKELFEKAIQKVLDNPGSDPQPQQFDKDELRRMLEHFNFPMVGLLIALEINMKNPQQVKIIFPSATWMSDNDYFVMQEVAGELTFSSTFQTHSPQLKMDRLNNLWLKCKPLIIQSLANHIEQAGFTPVIDEVD